MTAHALRFYSVRRDGEFSKHASLHEASKEAEAALDSCRDEAIDDLEWPEDVDGIEFGHLLPVAFACAVDNAGQTDNSEGTCDYALLPSGFDNAEHIADLERQLADAKAERDAAVTEMAKARHKATDCEAARDLMHWVLYDRAEEVGGQFKRLYDEWSKMKRQLAESRAEADALDSELTKIRVALTAAGIPEVEPYPEEDVSDLERSLRAGGRVIGNVDRIRRLAESRAEVERLRGAIRGALESFNDGDDMELKVRLLDALEQKP